MNIGLIAPIPSDGTSLYRAHGPFAYIARETGAHLVTSQDWDWTNIIGLDVMFLQRPFSEAHVMVARTCRALNVPIWVDYDDLYLDFPDWALPQKFNYGNPRVAANMRQILDLADVVTVSTDGLKSLSPKAQVIPNALNTTVWPLRDKKRTQAISWRGSGGHLGDMESVLPGLERLASAYPDWPQHYYGVPHYKCVELGTVHPFCDAFSWMENFYDLAPAVHVVPLVDCAFNRAKSNNSWLEATAVGAVTVAPNLPEWVRPGIVNYSGPSTFYETVAEVLKLSEQDRRTLYEQSHDYIKASLTLAKVNQRRMKILEGLAA